MPESAHRFPLIIEGPRPDRRRLYRSMKSFDDPPGAVTFWGDVQLGDQVRLGMGNDASLLRTAARLPAASAPEAAVLYSCVGREVVLGNGAAGEAAAVYRALQGAPLSGFFSFGEIGPTPGGGPAFYNQTAILILLTEASA
jgi:small ligand-binding sensory domain FIST